MNFNLVRLENFGSEICLSAFPGREHTNVFSIDLMEEFELGVILSPARRNGAYSMLKTIKQYAKNLAT